MPDDVKDEVGYALRARCFQVKVEAGGETPRADIERIEHRLKVARLHYKSVQQLKIDQQDSWALGDPQNDKYQED